MVHVYGVALAVPGRAVFQPVHAKPCHDPCSCFNQADTYKTNRSDRDAFEVFRRRRVEIVVTERKQQGAVGCQQLTIDIE